MAKYIVDWDAKTINEAAEDDKNVVEIPYELVERWKSAKLTLNELSRKIAEHIKIQERELRFINELDAEEARHKLAIAAIKDRYK